MRFKNVLIACLIVINIFLALSYYRNLNEPKSKAEIIELITKSKDRAEILHLLGEPDEAHVCPAWFPEDSEFRNMLYDPESSFKGQFLDYYIKYEIAVIYNNNLEFIGFASGFNDFIFYKVLKN